MDGMHGGQIRDDLRHDAERADDWLIDTDKAVGLARRDIGTLTILGRV